MYVEGWDWRKGQKKKSVGVCLECAEGMPPENSPIISCQMLILAELRKDTNIYIYVHNILICMEFTSNVVHN
jgi:hypothetical protein